MSYDAHENRIGKGEKQYFLEGKNLESTYDRAGNLVDKYLRGVVVDEIVNGYHYNNPNDWINSLTEYTYGFPRRTVGTSQNTTESEY